jgi:hypothetical protein
MESDQYSDTHLMYAYNQGWNSYPKVKREANPFKGDHPILEQSWDQGWTEHMKEPTNLSEIGF